LSALERVAAESARAAEFAAQAAAFAEFARAERFAGRAAVIGHSAVGLQAVVRIAVGTRQLSRD